MLRSNLAPLLVVMTLGLAAACASAAPPTAQPGTRAAPAHAPASPAAQGAKAGAEAPAPAAPPAQAKTEAAPALPAAAPASETDAPPPIEPRTVVLNVGDSFLMAGFSQALRPRMKSVGALYETRSEQASYTTTWHLKLAKLVGDYHPDLVIINLGANEVTLTDPPARADAVARLIKIIGDRPCVWVTPPGPSGWMPSACREIGGAAWAEAFWKWLEKERAPAPKPGEKLAGGSGRHAVNPWRLKPAPPVQAPALQKTASTAP
jgi:hypothetical protein